MSALLPNWLPPIWLLLGVLAIIIVTIEGSYRLQKNKIKNNWILDYQTKEGKLPPLQDFMLKVFENYKSGTPLSRDLQPIYPSGQFWKGLLPTRRRDLCILWEWLGKDPNDYLQHLKQLNPDISLDLGDGNEKGWVPTEQSDLSLLNKTYSHEL